MDVKEMIEKLVGELTKNTDLLKTFNINPTEVVEKVLGSGISADQIQEVVKAVQGKVSALNLGSDAIKNVEKAVEGKEGIVKEVENVVEGALDALKKLTNK